MFWNPLSLVLAIILSHSIWSYANIKIWLLLYVVTVLCAFGDWHV